MSININAVRNDDEKLLQLIRAISIVEIKGNLLNDLISVFIETENYRLRNSLSMKLADTHNPVVLPYLVDMVRKHLDTNHVGTLIYACSQFDCHSYFLFFIDVIILKNDSALFDAFSVIENIKMPIKISDKIIAGDRLNQYAQTLTEDHEKRKDIRMVMDFIEGLETV